jgi:hypothetical protein
MVAQCRLGRRIKDQPQVPLAGDQHPVQALTPGAGDPALAITFARGAWTGVLMIRSPAAVGTASNASASTLRRVSAVTPPGLPVQLHQRVQMQVETGPAISASNATHPVVVDRIHRSVPALMTGPQLRIRRPGGNEYGGRGSYGNRLHHPRAVLAADSG